MAEYTIRDFIQESKKQEAFYNEQIGRFDKILEDYQQKINDLQNRKESVLDTIVKKYVPEFDDLNLKSFSEIFNSKEAVNFNAELGKEKIEIQEKLRAIESEDEFKKSEALIDPQSGVIATQVQEIKPIYDRAKALLEKITSFPSFEGLNERHYGTDLYPHKGFAKYFSSEYYKDWKYSDIIIEELKMNNFVDVLIEYDQAKNQVTALGASLKDYNDQIVRIKKLIKDHKELQYRSENLGEIYYKKLKDIVYNFFKRTEKTDLQKFTESNTDIENQFKTLDGLDHQIEYIKQLYEKLTNDRNVLVEKSGKISVEASKYQLDEYKYRNKRFTQEQFDKRFSRDEDRYDQMYNRYDRYGNTVYVFNDYYRSSFISDFLWWDLISGGRLDGNFIPEVHDYHSTHADYSGDISSSSYDQS
jgi:hypothetical protein